MTDLQRLKEMHNKAELTINWSEEGGGLVHKIEDRWLLFEVPQYGGKPQYEGTYSERNLQKLIDTAKSWT